VLASGRPNAQVEHIYTNWDRARLSIVIPIGMIVAVAIICNIVAVLSSAEQADHVAIEHEKSLFSRALTDHGQRVLRELENVVQSEETIAHISGAFDRDWVEQYVAHPLERNFDHDYVLIFGGGDEPLLSMAAPSVAGTIGFDDARGDFAPLLAFIRGDADELPDAIRLDKRGLAGKAHPGVVVIREFMQRPAIIAASAIGKPADIAASPGGSMPVVLSVKFIGRQVLAEVASSLSLANLRKVTPKEALKSKYVYTLVDPRGRTIAHFAWSPQQPGAEIVNSVVPFVAVALVDFALLAAFVLRYMRRTATAIAAS
jgi:sensor domain CHASE-containing protein